MCTANSPYGKEDGRLPCTNVTQTIDGYSLLAFLPFVVIAPGLGLVMSRKLQRPWWLLTLTVASIGAILAVTLGGRMLKLTNWGRSEVTLSWLFDGGSWRRVLETDRTWALNALLFVPAGCLLTMIVRRAWVAVVSMLALSFLIEVVQRSTRLGVADVSDLVANIIGAAAGSAVAVVIHLGARIRADR